MANCEKCGAPDKQLTKLKPDNDGIISYKCKSCNHSGTIDSKKVNKPTKDKDDKESGEIPWREIKAIIFAVFVGVMFLKAPQTKDLNLVLLEVTAIMMPSAADWWSTGFLTFLLIAVGAVAFTVWYTKSSWVGMGWILGVGVILVGLPMISQMEGGIVANQLEILMCTLRGDMTACLPSSDGGDADAPPVKVGVTDVVKITFDTKASGNIVYKNVGGQIQFADYYLQIIVENLGDTLTVDNFMIISDSVIKRGGRTTKTLDRIPLAKIEVLDGICIEGKPCTIDPGKSITITLKATSLCEAFEDEVDCGFSNICEWKLDESTKTDKCQQKQDSMTTEIDAEVEFSYDYKGEGKYDLLIAKSNEVLESMLSSRDSSKIYDGPVNVEVKFAPTTYVFRSPDISETQIAVMVKLSKDVGGTADINDIQISRSSDGVLERPERCTFAGNEYVLKPKVDENGEESAYSERIILGGNSFPLSESHTYVCRYTAYEDFVGDDGEKIPFVVRADYNYEKTVTKGGIDVERIQQ